MKKLILFSLIIILSLFHVAWYTLSQSEINKRMPDEQSVTDFQGKLSKILEARIDAPVIESTFLSANNVNLHLDILKHGMGKPSIVFIPGTSIYAQVYAEFLFSAYNSGFNVIGFDPRGHGRSSGLRGDYTINEIVDDTLAVVDYAEKRFGGKIAVVGSSQGGIAAFYAAAREDSIAAVVCHNLADLNGKDNLILSRLSIPEFLSPLSYAGMSLYENFAIPVSLYLDLNREILKNGNSAANYIETDPLCISWITMRAMRSLLKTDLAKPVEEITVPLMLIHSDNDTIFPQKYVENLFNRLNCDKEYLLLKNTSHLVMTNNVPEIEPAMSKWLKKTMGYN